VRHNLGVDEYYLSENNINLRKEIGNIYIPPLVTATGLELLDALQKSESRE
jgi:hypothetical protein